MIAVAAIRTPSAPIAALRGSTALTRGPGRPADETVQEAQVFDLAAYRSELRRGAEKVLPFARFARDRIALLGDAQALTAQGIVILHLERQMRRHPDDAA